MQPQCSLGAQPWEVAWDLGGPNSSKISHIIHGSSPKAEGRRAQAYTDPYRQVWDVAAEMQHNSINSLFGSCSSGFAGRVLLQNNSSTSQNSAFNVPMIPKAEEPTGLLNSASCCSLLLDPSAAKVRPWAQRRPFCAVTWPQAWKSLWLLLFIDTARRGIHS